MATVKLVKVNKVYEGGVHAVHDFSIDIKDKEFIVFVGPSGCGKSTTLRMIAGLEEITTGDLYIDDVVVNTMAPKDRDIAMVFQSYALYPQMTVYKNMAYALKLRKVPKEEIDARVLEAAKILKLTPYLYRRPKALSGGQRQRVALGRAIVRQPKVFLMDEPLSNLDAKLRVAMRSEIVRIHESVKATTIYVTHDQIEAMTMASRIVVMKDGFIQQIGEPNEIYQYPTNMFVAGFIGTPAMNFIHGELLENGGFKIDDSDDVIQMTKEQMLLLKNYVGHRLVYGIRPENLVYEKDEAFHKLENYSLTMTTKMVELLGDIINVHGSIGQKNIILKTTSAFKIKANETIRVAIKPEQARFFNETTTKAITMEYYDFEEVEVTESLDEDNVIIVEEKKKGLIAKALNKIKDRKKEKDETKDL
ncbi:MAG: sn-glycerol-3-phosphate ABC transporter ATP-binding protein UgpC [Acholeplasmatales bacterium]|jgi:multiple sugar transport system ATP-binding protein|nr:sn-glycerol-3-phosphate ABC transporter ATP-binding protein UgpC [Acholeplasmatales bacterium]MCI9654223.1 sn-glycerol-3-phosphate ABC transporter ATP-binding protein UgpC [Acholeplasmatales bacterium]